jgi:Arf-GAP/SH3 domain/ANK repeat/PH domain-containing protein
VSAQSLESQISTIPEYEEITSPQQTGSDPILPLPSAALAPKEPIKIDVSYPRPADDMSMSDDGPVFRATMKSLEQKTGNMRMQMKRLIKKAEYAHQAQQEANDAFAAFMEALKEVSATNANAVQPAIEHYFDKIAREILLYERQNTSNLQKIVIDPVNKLYQMDIKQAESKKRDFEEESKEFYSYVSRYLGQRHDSVKAKQSDTKYQTKRRNFELKRFDYSSFMQDLSGGRKEQEVLSHLTKFADAQAQCFMRTAGKVGELLPQLEALSTEVLEADTVYQYQRREREEKRRLLEKSNLAYNDPEPPSTASGPSPAINFTNGTQPNPDTEMGRADSTGSQLRPTRSINSSASPGVGDLSRSPGSLGQHSAVGSPLQNSKFKGIRDLEERDPNQAVQCDKEGQNRKEGLLWALNRPGGHVDPRNLNKQGWHKYVPQSAQPCQSTANSMIGSGLSSTKESYPNTATGSRSWISTWSRSICVLRLFGRPETQIADSASKSSRPSISVFTKQHPKRI